MFERKSELPPSIGRFEKMSRTTGRGLEFYQQLLYLQPQDLEGKSILNVGAGKSDIGQELRQQGVHPEKFVNMDFAYGYANESPGILKRISGKVFTKEDLPENAVVGDMKHLPFDEGSFDQLLYLWALSWVKEDEKPTALQESFRVCATGGQIRVYPIAYTKKALAAAEKYPFLIINNTQYDADKLSDAGLGGKGLLGKMAQYYNNFDAIQIERAQRFFEGLRGKTVGTLIIEKYPDVKEGEFTNAIHDLEESGFIF